MLQMAELLIHSHDVPEAARTALATALTVPADQRRPNLMAAARILATHGGLDCEDACELVGLGGADCQ